MVGLLPLCASTVFEEDVADAPPEADGADRALPEAPPRGARPRGPDRRGLHRLRRTPAPLAPHPDEARARPRLPPRRERVPRPYGIRAALAPPPRAPVRLPRRRARSTASSTFPAESNTGMFGGNSNWRGPVWMPVNALIVRGLLNLYGFYGDDFTVECPTGSGNRMTLFEVAKEISRRLSSIFLRDASGRRPVYGGTAKFQDDPHWRDLILFYEYFHGDNGAGLGASHQTGWTGLVARLLDLFGRVTAQDALETPKERLEARLVREQVGGRRRRHEPWPTPRYPSLFQVNTRVRLSELSAALGRPATLDDIPDAELDRLAADGFDLVWFLGVWQTGEAARRVSRSNPEWLAEYRRVLPDFREADVCGSCFAVRDYRVHEDFGGRRGARPPARAPARPRPAAHPRLRPEPHGAGPPLGRRAPGLLRRGDGGAARRTAAELLPRAATGPGARILAYGRDPYFDGWPDTLQLNYGNPALQEAMLGELAAHRAPVRRRPLRHGDARPAGGLRADLGDLRRPRSGRGRRRPSAPRSRASSSSPRSTGTSSGRSSSRASTTPTTSGSTTACEEGHARPVREHLFAGLDFQDHLARFLENHDEPRAAATFAPEVHRAAAVITFLTPGLRFFHQGQREGKRVRIPVHLGRGPDEATRRRDRRVLRRPARVPEGPGLPRRPTGSSSSAAPPGTATARGTSFVAFSWTGPGPERRLVAVNYADHQSQCYVAMPGATSTGGRGASRTCGARRLRPPGKRPHVAGPLPRHARVGLPRLRRLPRGVT